jgi:hypothetical protein
MRKTSASIIAFGLFVGAGAVVAQPEPGAPPPPPEPQPPAPPTAPPDNLGAPPEPTPTEPRGEPSDQATATPAVREKMAPPADTTKLEIYGFVMLDGGFDFGHVGNPNWFDTMRPTKLPAFEDEFGTGPRTFAGVRQTRFGTRATIPTEVGTLDGKFEWEMFGVGVDEGQTTIRLRHAYIDWKQLRAGQTWSPFMDIDVFPNSIEYWGPNGMPFFRNVQVAWMPIQGDSRVTIAAERPGASADKGSYAERVELVNVVPRFPIPDFSAEARYGGAWGYVEGAGIVRWIKWDDLDPAAPDLSGDVVGWGVTASSNIKLAPALLRLQAVYGEGIENYMNDAPADVAPDPSPAAPTTIKGVALPVLGLVGFVDFEWSKQFTSSAGWSFVWIDNSEGQTSDAFHIGHYALANLLYHPTEKLMLGGEFQFGRRENNSDDFSVNDYKLQFSVRYNFTKTFGGE